MKRRSEKPPVKYLVKVTTDSRFTIIAVIALRAEDEAGDRRVYSPHYTAERHNESAAMLQGAVD